MARNKDVTLLLNTEQHLVILFRKGESYDVCKLTV